MTILEACTEQEAHDAAVNGELIEPVTQAPSVAEVTATDVIVIDEDHDTDDIVAWQECITEIKQEPVETDVVNATLESQPVIEGTIHNEQGQRRSARLARNYENGQVHLTYRGNPYTLTEEGSVQYGTDSTYVEGQAHFSVSTIQQAFADGVTLINVSEGDSLEMTQEEIYKHVKRRTHSYP